MKDSDNKMYTNIIYIEHSINIEWTSTWTFKTYKFCIYETNEIRFVLFWMDHSYVLIDN